MSQNFMRSFGLGRSLTGQFRSRWLAGAAILVLAGVAMVNGAHTRAADANQRLADVQVFSEDLSQQLSKLESQFDAVSSELVRASSARDAAELSARTRAATLAGTREVLEEVRADLREAQTELGNLARRQANLDRRAERLAGRSKSLTLKAQQLQAQETQLDQRDAALDVREAPAAAEPEPVAPQPFTSSCDSNYSGCVPIDSDVDCAGGSGNGPSYVEGPVQVIGSDIYGLDGDNDGIGCE